MTGYIDNIIHTHYRRHSEDFRETFYKYAQAYDQWVQGQTALDDEESKRRAAEFADTCPALAELILHHHKCTGDLSGAHLKTIQTASELVRAKRVGFFVS